MASEHADMDVAADAANAEPVSSSRPGGEQKDRPTAPGPTVHVHGPSSSCSSKPSSSSPAGPVHESSSKPRRTPFPISFPPLFFQLSKAPSATLAPSTAEGRPVPVADSADSQHTSALQQLNSKYWSVVRRQGCTPEAPAAQSSTYSQPVLVRTYSGPPPSRGSRSAQSRSYRPPSSSREVPRRMPLPSSSTSGSRQPIEPTLSDVGVSTTSRNSAGSLGYSSDMNDGNTHDMKMTRPRKVGKSSSSSSSSKLPLPWPWHSSSRQEPEEPKLPPLEAFSFKSFMADIQAQGGDNDIGADLDRIAEICARSRYSLSNQYEVHVAPHGSGASFTSGVGPPSASAPRRKGHSHSRSRSHGQSGGGPTLQAITSDDESSSRSHPRRKNGDRRKSAAYGTLETIMSSSRSSEEDKSKKKPAAELVGEIRGRAATKKARDNPNGSDLASASVSASTSTGNGGIADAQVGQANSEATNGDVINRLARKKSASFATAIMDNGRSSKKSSTPSSTVRPNPSATQTSALLSEPAQPQTSNSHLGVRTAPGDTGPSPSHAPRQAPMVRASQQPRMHPARGARRPQHGSADAGREQGGWSAWIPWRTGQQQAAATSHAEGSLRQLLRSAGDAPSAGRRVPGAGG